MKTDRLAVRCWVNGVLLLSFNACAPGGEQLKTGSQTNWLTVDASVKHQQLVGFGASLAYAEDEIIAHPQKAALFDTLFGDSGFEIVRLRNRYEGNADVLTPAAEILAAASARLGHTPVVFMTEGSPPASLKSNRARTCSGATEGCTLAQLSDGSFDYPGLGKHWRASLEAHAALDIVPDYVSIQNDPDWLPIAEATNEACRFLPEAGLSADAGSPPLPGYREALDAVRSALAGLASAPRFAAPEVTQIDRVEQYAAKLNSSAYDVLAVHLYEIDASAIDRQRFQQLRDFSKQVSRPVFQSEMRAGGLETAVLIHYALTDADAVAYLQNDFVASAHGEGDESALVALTSKTFSSQGAYHALWHFARYTAPGWRRVDTSVPAPVLGSAWLAPKQDAMTVVLVNPEATELSVTLDLPEARWPHSLVTRTVFDGTERSALLGSLAPDRSLQMPGKSVVTVSLTL